MKCKGTNWRKADGKWVGTKCSEEATQMLSVQRENWCGEYRYETLTLCDKHADKCKYKVITQVEISKN